MSTANYSSGNSDTVLSAQGLVIASFMNPDIISAIR